MKFVPPAVAAALAIAPSTAQQWVTVDPVPTGVSHVFYEPARQRALAITFTGTWSFDGSQWHRHSPDGMQSATGFPFMTPTLAGFDTTRGKAVATLRGNGWISPARTFVTHGAGWQAVVNAIPNVLAPGVAFDPVNNELLAFGGTDTSYITVFDAMNVWNGTQWSVRAAATRPGPRHSAAMATDVARSRIVLFGGDDGSGLRNDTWEWDGAQWTQFTPSTPPSPRFTDLEYDPAAQCVVALGGQTWSMPLLTDCWRWNGAQWLPHGTLPEQAAAIGYHDGVSQFVVTGIKGANVWRRNGAAWSPVWLDAGPPPSTATIGFDPTRAETLFLTTTGQTWAWNGAWQQRASGAPAARTGAALEPLGTDMIHFGGTGLTPYPGWSFFDETWRWNGLSWAQLQPAVLPPARFDHAMANVGSTILLFGGKGVSGDLADTWGFDGANWSLRTPAQSPSPRTRAGLAHDPLRQRTVLYGGQSGTNGLGDTWEFDGTNWIAHTPAHQPWTGGFHMAFDAAAGVVAMPQWDATYTWNGVDWSQVGAGSSDPTSRVVFDTARNRLVRCSVFGSIEVSTPTPAQAFAFTQFCGNRPDVRLFGRAAIGTTPLVHTEGAANTLTIVAYSLQSGLTQWTPGCNQLIGPIGATLAGVLGPTGQLSVPFGIPFSAALRGVNIHAQSVVLDGGPVFGASLSGALHLTVGD